MITCLRCLHNNVLKVSKDDQQKQSGCYKCAHFWFILSVTNVLNDVFNPADSAGVTVKKNYG